MPHQIRQVEHRNQRDEPDQDRRVAGWADQGDDFFPALSQQSSRRYQRSEAGEEKRDE
jgi:hypothetical protein